MGSHNRDEFSFVNGLQVWLSPGAVRRDRAFGSLVGARHASLGRWAYVSFYSFSDCCFCGHPAAHVCFIGFAYFGAGDFQWGRLSSALLTPPAFKKTQGNATCFFACSSPLGVKPAGRNL